MRVPKEYIYKHYEDFDDIRCKQILTRNDMRREPVDTVKRYNKPSLSTPEGSPYAHLVEQIRGIFQSVRSIPSAEDVSQDPD